MARRVKFSLKYKIALLILSLIVTTMAVIFVYSVNMNLSIQQREIRKSARQVSDTLSALRLVSTLQAKGVDWGIYRQYMEILTKLDKNIILLAILDKTGEMKAYSVNVPVIRQDFKKINTDKEPGELAKELLKAGIKDVLKVTGQIKVKGEQQSQVIIKFSKVPYNKRMNITILNMIILTLLLLAAGTAGAFFMAHLITVNFNIIAAGMRKVAGGNLDVSVDVKSNDETGVLADDFNRMIVELKEKVRIKDAFDTVADGLKDMDDLKKAYKVLTYQEMTDKMTKGYYPHGEGGENPAVFIFIDISCFSSFTFELISAEFREIIEKFVSKVSMTALEYQGAVLKVTDKFVLISFGYPFSHKDDMKRAVISTVEIRKELVALVKSKLTLGYDIEDFSINFVMIKGNVVRNFVDRASVERYSVITDYLAFASKYGEKKKYAADVYASDEIAAGTAGIASFETVDNVALPDGTSFPLHRLKGTKF